jgi:hypothetical protein
MREQEDQMVRRLIAAAMVVMSFGAVLAVPGALADTTDIIEPQFEKLGERAKSGFQSGTCVEDEAPLILCSGDKPELFFTTAAGHPPIGFTQYIIQHSVVVPETVEPITPPIKERTIKTLRTDLPEGLTVNPEATVDGEGKPIRCSLADFERELEVKPGEFLVVPNCPEETIVGRNETTLVVNTANAVPAPPPAPPGTFLPVGFVIKPSKEQGTKVPLYNLEPNKGEPAKLGFVIAGKRKIFLETEVAWESDYHESFTIKLPDVTPPFSTLKSRLISEGRSGIGNYITNPTTCFDPESPDHENTYTTFFRAESWADPETDFPNNSTKVGSKLPPGVKQKECESVPFDPTIDVTAGTNEVDSPAAPKFAIELPYEPDPLTQERSHMRDAVIAMPPGMGLNPAAANGLGSCTDAQFAKGVRVESNSCPAASKIGTAEVDSPPLHVPLQGDVYLGEQLSRDPISGQEYRIFVEAHSAEEGIFARLIGNVFADPQTGNLKAAFFENPQVPFETVTLALERQVLTSPPVCGSHTTTTALEPWARPGTAATPSSSFALSSIPGGGACPTTMADRPFAPRYSANSDDNQGGAYSPFRVHIARPDGQQELKVVDVTLPEGLTGKLAGIPYCSESALAAAAGAGGKAEQASPSCSAASQIGNATTRAGSGSEPILIGGKAYLAGPYKGAPLSLAVITPAVAGPFDLGTVVVRVALFVDPKTTQVKAVSDVIPDVFGGAKLDLRTIDVDVDRQRFMRNPTDCSPAATSGTIKGGGADPTNPATFSSYAVSFPFQATNCGKLGFRPKLFTRLFGGAKSTFRGQHPKFRAILEAREGDANIGRTAVVLPHALFLDQGNIRTVCTRPQLASRTCPKAAIYGHAKAKTPLLDNPLKGPVYMVSSDNQLPDLVADLRGQVNVQLSGVISSKRGGLKTVFRQVPDVPVKKFILWMKGGRSQGLIVTSTDLCNRRQNSFMNLKAQNGKQRKSNRLKLKVDGCKKRR